MILYNIISSSSSGNCITIDDKIMLDCGVSYSKIDQYLKNIKLIFIDHQHQDHFKIPTIKKIAYKHPTIKFVVAHYLVNKLIECGVNKKNIIVLELEKWYDIGLCKIKLDMLYHDVPNCCIHLCYKNNKILYATDTSKIEHIVARNYDYYFIEANYFTDEELDEKIKEAEEKGEYTHLKRVKNTHLSQLQAINWLDKNKNMDSKYVFIHQHIDKEGKN